MSNFSIRTVLRLLGPVTVRLAKILADPRWQMSALVVLIVLPIAHQFWHFSGASSPKVGNVESSRPEEGQTLRFEPDAPQLAYMKISEVKEEPVPFVEPFAGRVTYDENHTVSVFAPVAGRVLKVLVQPGDRVKAGQPLMLLDVPDYADLHKASAELRLSEAAYERAKALFSADVLPRRALEEAENQLRQAQAEQQRAGVRLRWLHAVPSGVEMLAPQAGVVMERHALPGSEVNPGTDNPLFVISEPERVWVVADIPELSISKVKIGRAVVIRVDAFPEESFKGLVEGIGRVLDPMTRRVAMRCSVSQTSDQLKPEMFARVSVVDENLSLPKIQNAALVTEGLKSYVFVEKSPGVLQKREVELAFRGNGISYVSKGLSAGERVVSAGALLLNAELSGS